MSTAARFRTALKLCLWSYVADADVLEGICSSSDAGDVIKKAVILAKKMSMSDNLR